jgi:hypothetical protein
MRDASPYAFYFSAHGDRIAQLIILRNHTTLKATDPLPPRAFAAGARNAPISQKTLQFFKSTSG